MSDDTTPRDHTTAQDEVGDDTSTTLTDEQPHSEQHVTPGGPKRLERDTGSAVLGGVAAGLGRYLGLDPILVRLGFIVLALTGGVGVIAYIIAWVIVPADDGTQEPGREMQRAAESVPTWLQVVAVLLVALFVTGQLGGFPGSVAWAAVLIGAGILLFRDSDVPSRTGAASQAAGVPPAPGGPEAPGAWADAPRSAPYEVPAAPVPPAPPAPREPRSILGRLTVAAMLVVTGIVALLDNVGAITLAPRQYVALALVVLGTGLIVGTFWGRGRALILLGLALLPVLLLAGFPTGTVRSGVGERVHAPATIAEVQAGYELFAGEMVIDLSALRPVGDALTVNARHGLGELVIIVPPGVDVVTNGWMIAGEANLLDRVDTGLGVSYSHRTEVPGARGEIHLDVQMGLGTLTVRHAR
jgi:phage shock protein PspC (stress-responsive transcriptional regulator)